MDYLRVRVHTCKSPVATPSPILCSTPITLPAVTATNTTTRATPNATASRTMRTHTTVNSQWATGFITGIMDITMRGP